MNDFLPDIRFIDALVYLISTLKNLLNINKNTIDQAIEEFIDNLPKFIQSELKRLG
ncbi:hypothetical protein FC46_GL001820 [Lactobacillus kalixensis DSM 16043]|uniref:Uncharacterized protein n=1 Tax=Lactobacillus kalixensis DSM 16043 TaxID=1423763 RepID=A0A0R1U7B7_9LACO|nr:hypothetical protein FC46_GL001820 [Lactobacillus kalixensis DSM 16043]